MKINKVLSDFGLSENEIKVYTTALKSRDKNLTPYKISKLTEIPRTTVYDIVMNLSLKGLVELEQSDGFTKQQTKVKAANPSVLREIVWEKKRDLTKLDVELANSLSSLKDDFHGEEANADFQFFPGKEGLAKVYFGYTGVDEEVSFTKLLPNDALGRKNLNKYVKREVELNKDRKGLQRAIVPNDEWSRHVISYQFNHNPKYILQKQYRLIENPAFEQYTKLAVEADYIRIACAEEDEIWGIQIKSRAFAKSIKSLFELIWLTGKPVTKELVESWGPNDFFLEESKLKKNKKT